MYKFELEHYMLYLEKEYVFCGVFKFADLRYAALADRPTLRFVYRNLQF